MKPSKYGDPNQAHTLNPLPGCPYQQAAIGHFKRQQWRQAVAQGEQALLNKPLCLEAWLALGEGYSQLAMHAPAVSAYLRLLAEPHLPSDWYGRIYAGFRRANQAWLAMEVCRIAIRNYPEEDAAYFAMADQMSRLGYPAQGIVAVLERALFLAPKQDSYRISLALQLCRIKNWCRAYRVIKPVDVRVLREVRCLCSAMMLLHCFRFAKDKNRANCLKQVLRKLAETSRHRDSE